MFKEFIECRHDPQLAPSHVLPVNHFPDFDLEPHIGLPNKENPITAAVVLAEGCLLTKDFHTSNGADRNQGRGVRWPRVCSVAPIPCLCPQLVHEVRRGRVLGHKGATVQRFCHPRNSQLVVLAIGAFHGSGRRRRPCRRRTRGWRGDWSGCGFRGSGWCGSHCSRVRSSGCWGLAAPSAQGHDQYERRDDATRYRRRSSHTGDSSRGDGQACERSEQRAEESASFAVRRPPGDKLRAVVEVELGAHVADVEPDGVGTDAEPDCNLGIGRARPQLFQDSPLGRGEDVGMRGPATTSSRHGASVAPPLPNYPPPALHLRAARPGPWRWF